MKVRLLCDPALAGMLPRPVPARTAIPDWLRRMPAHAVSAMHEEPVRTVKHCPPFIDAMSLGFVLSLPCDVRVEAGRLSWDWEVPSLAARHHPRAPVAFHAAGQVENTPMSDFPVVKFNPCWTVELEEGVSLFVTHPANRFDLPFRLLSGLVDADRFHDVGILFPALWTDDRFEGVLPRGTPIAQCVPVRREELALSVESFTDEEARRFDRTAAELLTVTGHYRKMFRASRDRDGSSASEHLPQPLGIQP